MERIDGQSLENFQKVFLKRILGINNQQYHLMEIQLFFPVIGKVVMEKQIYMK